MTQILNRFANGHPPKKHIWTGNPELPNFWRALCGVEYQNQKRGVWLGADSGQRLKHGVRTVSCWECRKKYAAKMRNHV